MSATGEPGPADPARAEILARIRTALGPAATPEPEMPVAPRHRDAPEAAHHDAPEAPHRDASEDLVARFVERVADYRATVVVVEAGAVPATVRAICARHAVTRLAVPGGVPQAWVPGGVAVLAVGGADADVVRALDAVDGVLTSCALAVAETGTLVLDGGPGQGPRAATLLPDLHICVVEAAGIVAGVPELTVAMETAVRAHGRPLTLVSGPSATSDIELDRVEGVHGPRSLEVIVALPTA